MEDVNYTLVMTAPKSYLISMVPADNYIKRLGKEDMFGLYKESCDELYDDDNERVYDSQLFYDYLDGELRFENDEGETIEGEVDFNPIVPVFHDLITQSLKKDYASKYYFVQVEELLNVRTQYEIPTTELDLKLENIQLQVSERLSNFKFHPKTFGGISADVCTNFVHYKQWDHKDSIDPRYVQCNCVDIEWQTSEKRWLSVCDSQLRPFGTYDGVLDDTPITPLYLPNLMKSI